MPDEPVPDDAAGLRAANARLRAVVESQAAEIGGCGRAGCRPGADPAARAAFADPSVGAHAGVVSCGPGLNAAAVMLTAYGNVPPERTARVIGMILGTEVSDPVHYVSYFNGGDAVHFFSRGGYGYNQSLGCVELPWDAAKTAYPYLTYGSLVTVTGPVGG